MQEAHLLVIKEVLKDIKGITFELYCCVMFRNSREAPVMGQQHKVQKYFDLERSRTQ